MAETTLLVIIDPFQDEQPALVRAVDIVTLQGGHIHAFCCVYQEDLSSFSSRKDAKRLTLQVAEQKVQGLLAPLRRQGIAVSSEVIWNQEWFQSAVHASSRVGADLVIKSTFAHAGGYRKLSKRSDYYLLRNSACPVLLTKSAESQRLQTILAAVAVEDGDHEHDSLNNRIVAQSKRLRRVTGAELHLVAALEGNPDVAALLNLLVDEEQEKLSDQQLISERFGVEADHIHVDFGSAAAVITATAQSMQASIVVVGCLARKGIKGALLGNTAEKIIDALPMDILAIN